MSTAPVKASYGYWGGGPNVRARTRATFTTQEYSSRTYVSPAHRCDCDHGGERGPRHLLSENASPALTYALICFYCGTILSYVDERAPSPVDVFRNMLHARAYVTRRCRRGGRRTSIGIELEGHGVGQKIPPPVLARLVRAGLRAGLSWVELARELGLNPRMMESLCRVN